MINFDWRNKAETLNKYGISFDHYEINFGALIGKFVPPTNLLILNPELKNNYEICFYILADNIFKSANNILDQKPSIINPSNFETFINFVGERRAHNFRLAVYEEIKYRCLSNYLPELDNKTTFSAQNFNVNENKRIITSSYDLLTNTALEYLEISDWNEIDVSNLEATEVKTKNLSNAFLLKDFSNIELNRNDWNKVLQVSKTENDEFILSFEEKLKNANLDGCNIWNCLINETFLIDCNIVGNSTIAGYDDSKTVDAKIQQQIINAGNFPWNKNTIYAKDQSCIYNTKFYVSLVSNNKNNVPDASSSKVWKLKPDLLPELYFNKNECDNRYVVRGEEIVFPVGFIVYYPRKLNPKPKWLLECNNQSFSTIDYPELYKFLNSSRTPNLNGRVLANYENSNIGSTAGNNYVYVNTSNLPNSEFETSKPEITIPIRSGWDYDSVSDNDLRAISGTRTRYKSGYYGGYSYQTIQLSTYGNLVSTPKFKLNKGSHQSLDNRQPTYYAVAYIVAKNLKINGFNNYNDALILEKIRNLELKVNELITNKGN